MPVLKFRITRNGFRTVECSFCRSPKLDTRYTDVRHKIDAAFGPFDLYECGTCGSMGTRNPPTPDRLAEFYRKYEEFRPDWYLAASKSGALSAQYKFYADFVSRQFAGHSWVDVGAGHGEISSILARKHADGVAVDIGPRPKSLDESVHYMSVDMNEENWHRQINRVFDTVFSVAVWEHVIQPGQFARECLQLVGRKGRLIIICPDYGSFARKVLNRSWPYFEPGEHISVPSKIGARHCIQREAAILGLDVNIEVKNLNVGYSIQYLLQVLRLRSMAKLFPPEIAAPMPTGVLTAIVSRL